MLLLPEPAKEHPRTADIFNKAAMGWSLKHTHLEPDSRNISDSVTSPSKPSNEHLILRGNCDSEHMQQSVLPWREHACTGYDVASLLSYIHSHEVTSLCPHAASRISKLHTASQLQCSQSQHDMPRSMPCRSFKGCCYYKGCC